MRMRFRSGTSATDEEAEGKDELPRNRPSPRTVCMWIAIVIFVYQMGFLSGSIHLTTTQERGAVPVQPKQLEQIPAAAPAEGQTQPAPAAALEFEDTEPEMEASPEHEVQRCLSFNRKMCPPLNLSIQTPSEQDETQKRCTPFVAQERQFGRIKGARFCGRRLKRLNPCWSERGRISCLPHFFILGEMKCGTTTIYNFLRRHPRVVVPRVKEPRFLQAGRFAQTTVSRYKVNFDAVVAKRDSVTFDASPVYLRSDAARAWLPRWLPSARLIVLVRNPSQRAYSHWKMGREWMASKCVDCMLIASDCH